MTKEPLNQDDLGQDGRIRSTIRMLIPLSKQSEALEILGNVHSQIQFEPNCISTRIYRGADEVRTIMVEELWKSYADIQRHLRSDAYRRILMVIEMADEPPDIRFETIAGSGGVEVIKEARSQD